MGLIVILIFLFLHYNPCNFNKIFREEDLVVRVKDEVFYSERLPDTVIVDQCKIRNINKKKGQVEIEIILTKETHGLWLSKWHIER